MPAQPKDTNVFKLVVNRVTRDLGRMFPGYFPETKHNHYHDFGFPVTLGFDQLLSMYNRNGIARAAVVKTVGKTWQDSPFLLEKERDGSEGGDTEETSIEKELRQRFADLRLWAKFAEADRRSLVGCYAGIILRFADGKTFDQPADRVPGGLDGLVEVIPAWEAQLTVAQWDDDQRSPTYGQPLSFMFNEAAVGGDKARPRSFTVHPSRVIVWSPDGTVNNTPWLEPGYNDLISLEKVIGGGGEGFWKNAKSAPILSVDKEIRLDDMARLMGVKVEDLHEKFNDQVEDWQKGFDKMLMVQGMTPHSANIAMPNPEYFFSNALQSFAASVSIPFKILVGMQTGERASTEDAHEFAQTCNGRRSETVIPNVMNFVNRLEEVGILPEKDWHLDWTDLTEASMPEKIDRASKMADVNQKMKDTGEFVFTPEEIRKAVDFEPLTEAEKYRDDLTDDPDESGILPKDKPGDPKPKDA